MLWGHEPPGDHVRCFVSAGASVCVLLRTFLTCFIRVMSLVQSIISIFSSILRPVHANACPAETRRDDFLSYFDIFDLVTTTVLCSVATNTFVGLPHYIGTTWKLSNLLRYVQNSISPLFALSWKTAFLVPRFWIALQNWCLIRLDF